MPGDVAEVRCKWSGCREAGVTETRWPNGASAWHCAEHHRIVLESLTAATAPATHEPGAPHEYELTCKVCGQYGVIRVSVDPQNAEPRP